MNDPQEELLFGIFPMQINNQLPDGKVYLSPTGRTIEIPWPDNTPNYQHLFTFIRDHQRDRIGLHYDLHSDSPWTLGTYHEETDSFTVIYSCPTLQQLAYLMEYMAGKGTDHE